MLCNNIASLPPAFEQNNIPVVLVINNLYSPYAGVFIQSLLDHAGGEHNYDIIIFEREVSKENKRLLKSLAAGHTNISIRFYDPSPLFASFHYDDNANFWPLEVLYKITAPHILTCSGRMIAVDADTLLKTDIARLMDEDLEGCAAGGVCDIAMNGMCLCDVTLYRNNIRIRDYYKKIYGSDDLKSFVNTGLLLFERDQYVRELDLETILDTAQQGEYLYPDQDALNILMKGRIKTLNFAWNVAVQSTPSKMKFIDAASKLYDGAFEQAYENPYLLHWVGRPKPWVCPDVPWGGEWWQTALKTPFVGHIIARMLDALDERRAYFRKRYGKDVEVWDPSPKGID